MYILYIEQASIKTLELRVDELRSMDFLSKIKKNEFPSSKVEVINLLESKNITDDEAELCREVIRLCDERNEIKSNIALQKENQKKVDLAQERIRKNIETLSKDSLKTHDVLNKYISMLTVEEEKYFESATTISELDDNHKHISSEIEAIKSDLKDSILSRNCLLYTVAGDKDDLSLEKKRERLKAALSRRG